MESIKNKFFKHLIGISLNLNESANYFAGCKFNDVGELKFFSEKMKEFESIGDNLVHDLIIDLNNAFITPIEREDLLALSIRMDDILDGLYHTAVLFEIYSIIETDDYMDQFIEAIKNCAIEMDAAIQQLSTKKLLNMREHAINIKNIEAHCDHVLRESIKQLFTVGNDPIRIIQYKQIYEGLEEIANSCKAVANTFETIIIKNA